VDTGEKKERGLQEHRELRRNKLRGFCLRAPEVDGTEGGGVRAQRSAEKSNCARSFRDTRDADAREQKIENRKAALMKSIWGFGGCGFCVQAAVQAGAEKTMIITPISETVSPERVAGFATRPESVCACPKSPGKGKKLPSHEINRNASPPASAKRASSSM